MKIRKTKIEDIEKVDEIYTDCRKFMRQSGNTAQWTNGYPSINQITEDIQNGISYVCEECGEILAVFVFFIGEDPTYKKIYNGAWLNDSPYGVIHRIGVGKNSHGKGVAAFCFEYCFSLCGNLKIDTHRDNIPMRKALTKNGFEQCGIIYLASGDERIAFQKSE